MGNLLRKEQERTECRKDFSTALEMTARGLVYLMSRTTDMLEEGYPHNVIPSEVEGSFLHIGIASYV